MEARFSRHRPPLSLRREFLPALLLMALGIVLVPGLASAQGAGSDTLKLLWTAPGDDGAAGTAARYEIRMSTSPITATNWDSATLIGGAPSPLPSGTRQSIVVRGLSKDTTYFFAIKTLDDADNVSPLSNIVQWDWILDTSPPLAPSGLQASLETNDEARLQWAPNTEPDLNGYIVYRAEASTGPFVALQSSPIPSTEFLDNTIPAEATQVWYQVSAVDASGNESARSAVVSLSLIEASGVFVLHPVYPNPSRGGEPVNIPIDVPTNGAGDTELQILDQGRRLVRSLPLRDLTGGYHLVVWDGRNDSDNLVAPGVFSIYLIGTGERHRVKCVRLP